MAVNDLLNVPHDDATWKVWSFHHRDSHKRIIQAIQAQSGIILTEYVLEPITGSDIVGFEQRNSQMHLDMNGVLRLESYNLQDVDLNNSAQLQEWMILHTQEHFEAERALNI